MKDNELSWKEIAKSWEALAKSYRADEERYKWLYKVACHIIHDIDGTPVLEIMKDLERLWNIKNNLDRSNANDN